MLSLLYHIYHYHHIDRFIVSSAVGWVVLYRSRARACHALSICFCGCACIISLLLLLGAFDPAARSLHLMGLREGRYVYWQDLRPLTTAAVVGSPGGAIGVPPHLSPSQIVSQFARCLDSYPDSRLGAFLVQGLSEGFRVGVAGRLLATPILRNHHSCVSFPDAIQSLITTERAGGRMFGPLLDPSGVHVNPIGLVPKGHPGNDWRMIVDLSHPKGIASTIWCPPTCVPSRIRQWDDAVEYIVSLGQYTQLVKIDLKSACRILPWIGHCWVFLGVDMFI